MSEGKGGAGMYLRLQIAYALEFAIWGCWSYALGTFCSGNNILQGWLYTAFALGALFSPVVGPIADKKFSAQKVFAFMQMITGVALIGCHYVAQGVVESGAKDPGALWIALMFVAGLMFMPSIPLLNAIVFGHIPNKDRSPLVFIFGTLGWIAVNLVISWLKDWGLQNFYLIDGAIAIALALYALSLPDTPPSGSSNDDPFGLKALKLFARPDFFIFMLCATLVGIFGSNFYFAFVGQCFPDKGVLNQFSEIFFMAALAFAVSKIGLKWVLTLGLAAWGVRYFCFASLKDCWALVGILCHGVAYAFLYTAAYMYGDKVAPKAMKASVQALIAFLLLGVAQSLSGPAANYMLKKYELTTSATPVVAPADAAPEAAPAEEATEPEETTADEQAYNFSSFAPVYSQEAEPAAAPEAALEAPAEAAQEVAGQVADAASDAADAVADAASNAVDVATDAASNAADAVADAASSAVDVATDAASNAADAVADAASNAVDAATDAAGAVAEATSNAVDAATDAASNAADAVADVASNAADAASDAAGAVADAAGAAKKSFLESLKTVWDPEERDVKHNWKMIWGIPAVFCCFWALVFALLGREPKPAEEEDEEVSLNE